MTTLLFPGLAIVSALIGVLSAGGILLVFLLYPLSVWLRVLGRKEEGALENQANPSISLIIVARNAEELIEEKLRNCFSLDYPGQLLEFIFYSDGSTDGTEEILRRYRDVARVRFFSSRRHHGKTSALNRCLELATGELAVFSDVDALLPPNALARMIRHYADPRVGGVCGRRVIDETSLDMKDAQGTYGDFDSFIKAMESRSGSITSNDGKLYSIRRKLFQPIPEAVTDDFYTGLSIVAQGYRFTFEPEARAHIRIPSRSPAHEVNRRRRIVSRSLRAIYLLKELLNPWKHGMFAIGLAINKVLRRLLPVFLLLLFFSTVCLSFHYPVATALLMLQIGFYGAASAYPAFSRYLSPKNRFKKATSVACYFCVGNFGTLLGLVDFLTGRKTTKWDPFKTD